MAYAPNPIPVRLPVETVARLDTLAERRSELAGIKGAVTRSDAVRLATDAGLRVLLDGAAAPVAPPAPAPPPVVEAAPPPPAVAPSEPLASFSDLAERFPALRGLPGVRPFDVVALEKEYQRARQGLDLDFLEAVDAWAAVEAVGQREEGSEEEEEEREDPQETRRKVHVVALIPFMMTLVQRSGPESRSRSAASRLRDALNLRLVRLLDEEHRTALASWFTVPIVPPPYQEPDIAALRERVIRSGVSHADLARQAGVRDFDVEWLVEDRYSLQAAERKRIAKALDSLGH